MHDERHELFEELEAFDPLWYKVYHNLEEAVYACGVETPYIIGIYHDYLSRTQRPVDGVPDIKRYIEECQKAEEESPFFQRAMQRMGIFSDV